MTFFICLQALHYFIVVIGEQKNFNMNDYYNLMLKAFNDVALSDLTGTQHALSEPQKTTKFTDGLNDVDAI